MSLAFSRFVRLNAVIFMIMFLGSVSWAPAQEDDLDYSSMDLEDLLNVEVTVASKSKETLADAPSSVTVFTRQEILNLGVSTVEELLNYVPGFSVSRTDEDIVAINTVSVRGRRPDSTSRDLLFLIDGVRTNDPWTGGSGSINTHMTIANVKQVEIIRGPGSALYGSNAFLGVVNIVTDTELNEAYVGLGNFEGREAYASLSHKGGNGINYSMFVRSNTDTGDDYKNLPDWLGQPTDTNDPEESFSFFGSMQGERWRFNVRHTEFENENFVMIGIVNNNTSFARERSTTYSGHYQLVQNDKWELKLAGTFFENRRKDSVPLFAPGVAESIGLSTNGQALTGGDFYEADQLFFNLDGSYHFNDKHHLSFGASYREANIDIVNFLTNFDAQALFSFDWPIETYPDNSPENGGPKGNAGSRDILGVYLQHKANLTEALTLTLGLRYDDYSDFGDTTNPRGALVYNAPFNGTFKVMYGEAFRAPSFREQSEVSLIFVGNPALAPETVTTLEVAWVQKFNRFQTTLTYFDTEIEDGVALALGEPDANGFSALTPSNVVNLSLSGIELETQIVFSEHVLLRGNFTKLSDTEEDPRRVPETTASLALNMNFNAINFNISGYYKDDIQAVLASEGQPEVILGSYWLTNATFRYTFEKFSVIGRANNLLDEDYSTYTSTTAIAAAGGLPARGRFFSIGAELKF